MNLADQLREQLKILLEKIINSGALVNFLVSIVMITFWVILAYATVKIIRRILLKTNKQNKKLTERESKEQLTVRRLINNVIRTLFIFWIFIMILGELGLDLLPLLAGAGIIAFAVGFGAQELIKDVISGFFLIVEKTFSLGDYVDINEFSGTITDVGIRRTRLENWKGDVITINNGDIRTVVNHSINLSVAVIDFLVDPKFDVEHFHETKFKKFLETFKNANADVVEDPNNPVIISFENGILLRITIKTKTRKQVGVEREFRKALVNYFADNNLTLEIPTIIKMDK